jgi:hypothetical protein
MDSVLGKRAASNVPKENLGSTFNVPKLKSIPEPMQDVTKPKRKMKDGTDQDSYKKEKLDLQRRKIEAIEARNELLKRKLDIEELKLHTYLRDKN